MQAAQTVKGKGKAKTAGKTVSKTVDSEQAKVRARVLAARETDGREKGFLWSSRRARPDGIRTEYRPGTPAEPQALKNFEIMPARFEDVKAGIASPTGCVVYIPTPDGCDKTVSDALASRTDYMYECSYRPGTHSRFYTRQSSLVKALQECRRDADGDPFTVMRCRSYVFDDGERASVEWCVIAAGNGADIGRPFDE